MPTIAINSFCFRDADKIISSLSEETGYPVVTDKQILEGVARLSGRSIESIEKTLDHGRQSHSAFNQKRGLIIQALKREIFRWVRRDNIIIDGAFGHLIPTGFPTTAKILVVGQPSDKNENTEITKSDKRLYHRSFELLRKSPFCRSINDVIIPTRPSDIEQTIKLLGKCHLKLIGAQEKTAQDAYNDLSMAINAETSLSELGINLSVSVLNGNIQVKYGGCWMTERKKRKIIALLSRIETARSFQIFPASRRSTCMFPWLSDPSIPPCALKRDIENNSSFWISDRFKSTSETIEYLTEKVTIPDFNESTIILDPRIPGLNIDEMIGNIKREKPDYKIIILGERTSLTAVS